MKSFSKYEVNQIEIFIEKEDSNQTKSSFEIIFTAINGLLISLI